MGRVLLEEFFDYRNYKSYEIACESDIKEITLFYISVKP